MVITINGYQINKIIVGQTYKESLENELDSLIIVYDDYIKPNFQAHDVAIVDGKKWIVGSYNTSLFVRSPKKYRTTLILVELTKLLERYIIGPCSFTNKTDTLMQQITKALNQAEILRVGESNNFVFSNPDDLNLSYAFINLLSSTPGEEFFFNSQMTLREVLDKMLSVLNYRIVVSNIGDDGKLHLHYRDLNRQSGQIKTLNNVVNESVNQNMEYLAGEYETLVKNAQSKERRVITEEWQTLKPVNGTLADTNSVRIVVSNQIEECIKLLVRGLWKFQYYETALDKDVETPTNYEDVVLDFDLTDILVEQEIYDTMDLPTQEAHIPYSRGSKDIGVLATYKKMFLTQVKLRDKLRVMQIDLIEQYLANNNRVFYEIKNSIIQPIDLYTGLLFQVSYIPYLDLHYSQTKETFNPPFKSVMISNQQDETVEVGRYASSLKSLANKLGNKALEIDVNINDRGKTLEELKTELLELGDRIENDYTLISREYSVYDIPNSAFIKVHYVFIEQFSNVLATKLSRERRLYQIPLENLVERDILIKDYLVLSSIKDLKSDGILNNEITLSYFLKTFNNSVADENTPIDRIMFGTTDGVNNYGIFSLALLGASVGNSMLWKFSCYDNFSVGLSTNAQTIGGKSIFQNPYVNENGEFKELNFQLIKTSIDEASFDSQMIIGKALPMIPFQMQVVYAKKDFTNGGKSIIVNKDRFGRFGMSYQLESIVRRVDAETIIIGDYFTKYSNLLYGKNTTELFVYTSTTETYRRTETKKCKGNNSNYKAITNLVDYKISPNVIPQTAIKSWAIGDADRNLVFAVNNNNTYVEVYLTISRERW